MVIPIRDTERIGIRPWVNYTVIAVNVGMLLLQALLPGDGERLIRGLAVVPAQIFDLRALAAAGFVPLLTLVSATFLHGGWLHLLGNMVFLWVFGDNVEDRLGHGRYILFYLAGGIVAGLAHVLANPESTIPTIGASGAVGAVLGAYAVAFPRARVLTLVPVGIFVPALRIKARHLLGFWFALQVLDGLLPNLGGTAMVAWWAHIGGFLAGMGLVRLLEGPRVGEPVQ